MPVQEERFVTYVGCAFAMKVRVKGRVTQFHGTAEKLLSCSNSDAFMTLVSNLFDFERKHPSFYCT